MKPTVDSIFSSLPLIVDWMIVVVGVLLLVLLALCIANEVVKLVCVKEKDRKIRSLEKDNISLVEKMEVFRSDLELARIELAVSDKNNKALKSDVATLKKSLEISVDERIRQRIEKLENEKNEATEWARRQVDLKSDEIASAKRETEAVRIAKDAEISDLNALHKSEIARVVESKDAEIALAHSETQRILSEKSAEITALKSSHARELKDACEAKDAEIALAHSETQRILSEKSAEITVLKSSHARDLKDVCEAKDAEIASAKRETEAVRIAKDAEISDLNALHKSEIARVVESKDAEIALAQSETQRILSEKFDEIASLKSAHVRELKDVCEAKDAEIASAKRETEVLRSAKDAEIAKIRRDCDEMLSRFWPTLGGENAEVSEIFTAWVEEVRSAESVSSPVMAALSHLFAWNSAFAAKDESMQWKELAEFGRSLFKWCSANKMPHESAWELSEKFIGEFNRILKTVPEIAYRVYEPKLGVAFDVKKMYPYGKDSVGRVERIDAWGIQKVDGSVLKRADVILKK